MIQQVVEAAAFPWAELVAVPGVGAALAMCWLFLKHIRENRQAETEASKRQAESVEKVTAEFSETVKSVSRDVKDGLDKFHETTTTLLKDQRDREERLHQLIRGGRLDSDK